MENPMRQEIEAAVNAVYVAGLPGADGEDILVAKRKLAIAEIAVRGLELQRAQEKFDDALEMYKELGGGG